MSTKHSWDASEYDATHRYVMDYGRGLVELLAPQSGERILDVGCGTGHLTHQISQAGAEVFGIDSSPEMIAQARQNYPKLKFQLVGVSDFTTATPFDAVFSNAVLHWVQPPGPAVSAMRAVLRPGGRLVVEFGGKRNVASILREAGRNPWYFPSIAEYGTLLEQHGFELATAWLFDRPTFLEGESGLRDWVTMFFKPPLDSSTIASMEISLRPQLFRDGGWWIDYRRLRIVAIAV